MTGLLFMSTKQLDSHIRRARVYLLIGLCLIAWGVITDTVGIATGFVSGFLGATLACLAGYRSEPGLWMLAVVFLAISSPLYILFEYDTLSRTLAGQSSPLFVAADTLAATILLWFHIRSSLTLIRFNRQVSW